jgi:hypothetical protein
VRVVVELLLVASQNVIRVEKATTPRLFRLEATKSEDTSTRTRPTPTAMSSSATNTTDTSSIGDTVSYVERALNKVLLKGADCAKCGAFGYTGWEGGWEVRVQAGVLLQQGVPTWGLGRPQSALHVQEAHRDRAPDRPARGHPRPSRPPRRDSRAQN